jgi:hypothetical protein
MFIQNFWCLADVDDTGNHLFNVMGSAIPLCNLKYYVLSAAV